MHVPNSGVPDPSDAAHSTTFRLQVSQKKFFKSVCSCANAYLGLRQHSLRQPLRHLRRFERLQLPQHAAQRRLLHLQPLLLLRRRQLHLRLLHLQHIRSLTTHHRPRGSHPGHTITPAMPTPPHARNYTSSHGFSSAFRGPEYGSNMNGMSQPKHSRWTSAVYMTFDAGPLRNVELVTGTAGFRDARRHQWDHRR